MTEEEERPNILWMVSEDNSCFVGCYGDDAARTPVIDSLAADGIRFDNAFAVAPVCAPSRFSIITGMYPPSVPGAEHMRADVPLPDGVRPFPAYLREAGYYCTNASKTDYNARVPVPEAWDECDDEAHWRHRRTGAPFFSVFNYMETHESCLFGDDRDPVTDPATVRVPAYLPDTPTVRVDLARYYDHMSALDAQLGERLAELEVDGLVEDTIVFYYSDHGGSHPRSKRFCYDSGLRVPLVVRVPERWRDRLGLLPGATDELITLMDLGPTVLSLAGVRAPAPMHGRAALGPFRSPAPEVVAGGRARMDERDDLVRTVRDRRYRYIRNYMPCLPAGQHMEYMWQQDSVREWERLHRGGGLPEAQDRFWRHKVHEELYDLHADQDETQNLAGDPAHAEAFGRLRRELDAHLLRIDDQGFRVEGSEHQDPYPLPTIMAVAGAAARHHQVDERGLEHPSETVRYWTAYGLAAMLACHHAPQVRGDLQRHCVEHLTACLADESAAVRLVAAEALATPESVETILRLYARGSGPIRLRAAAALDRLTTGARLVHEAASDIRATLRMQPTPTDRNLRKVIAHAFTSVDSS